MSGFQFVAALARALAWPVAIVGVAWLFRLPLTAFLERLNRVKLRAGSVWAEVRADTTRAEIAATEAEQVSGDDAGHGTETASVEKRDTTGEGGGQPALITAEGWGFSPITVPSLMSITRSRSIVMGWIFHTLDVNVRALLADKVEGAQTMDWNRLALIAHERGLIRTDTAVALQGLEVLYDLANASPDGVTGDATDEYLRMANGTLYAVHQNLRAAERDAAPA